MDPDDNLTDSLIDDVHFDYLVLEKDISDVIVFCNYYTKYIHRILRDIMKKPNVPASQSQSKDATSTSSDKILARSS